MLHGDYKDSTTYVVDDIEDICDIIYVIDDC